MSARFLQRIASAESPALLLKSWLFCAVYCAISFSIFYVFAFRAREIMPTLIGGFFALFGVVYVWVTFQKTLEYLRFGEVSLRLESAPALGGELLARLLWPAEGVRELRVELSASEWKTEKDSRGREVRRERVRWRDQMGNIETRDISHVFLMTGAIPATRWVALDWKNFIKTG